LFLGLKQTQRVSKQELKQTKAIVQANKQKTQTNISKKVAHKKNKWTIFFSYADMRSFGDDATLCLVPNLGGSN